MLLVEYVMRLSLGPFPVAIAPPPSSFSHWEAKKGVGFRSAQALSQEAEH